MKKKLWIILALGSIQILYNSCTREKGGDSVTESELIQRAKEIHERIMTLDTHVDIPVTFITSETPGILGFEKHVSWQRMDAGGLDGAFFAVNAHQGPLTKKGFESARSIVLNGFETIHRVIDDEMAGKIELAYHPEDVSRIHDQGKKFAMIGCENGYAVGEDLRNIKKFYDLGCRYITLSHFGHSQLCDSNSNPGGPESIHGGVSPFGKKVIAEMNRLGIIVDVSHISMKSVLDATRLSRAPVIASHSACRALCDVDRNIADEQLLAIKENGGVVNMVAITEFIKKDSPERAIVIRQLREEFGFPQELWLFVKALRAAPQEVRAEYIKRMGEIDSQFPPANVKDFVDHIDYGVKLMGIDHVGISADFFSSILAVEGWKHAGEMPNVTIELVRRGYTEEEIGKIWGGNLLQVWKDVERVARSHQ
jgi:membrane dipeptidase